MTGQNSFWRRVARLFRPDATGSDDHTADPDHHVAAAAPPGRQAVFSRSALLRAAPTRDLALRVVELADAMQEHFRRQDERVAELTAALDRVGGILEQLGETQRTQGECLRTIAAHGEAATRHTAAVADTLNRIPDSLLAQAEAIRTVARQVELAQESDRQFIQSLQHFGQAVDTLGAAGSAQVQALQHLSTAQQMQQSTLTDLLREQSRRFLIVVIVLGVLVIAGLTTLVVTFALRGTT